MKVPNDLDNFILCGRSPIGAIESAERIDRKLKATFQAQTIKTAARSS
ncbi:hypothetical protein [Microcoleus sp. herbarium14]